MEKNSFVGSCNVSMCSWNKNNDCSAPAITVEKRKEHADCDTFLNEDNPWQPEQ